MIIKIKIEKEVNARLLHVFAGVRYWEDSSVNGVEDTEGTLIPCREGELWKPVIDIDNGKIINWKQGCKAEIHYKVCDAGHYTVSDENSEKILEKEGYVPSIMCPQGGGYGDYIIMNINEDGFIDKWQADLSDFIEED